MKKVLLIIFVPAVALIISLATISHYGINWDETIHFMRGQAALHFALTGKVNFADMPGYYSFEEGALDYTNWSGKVDQSYLDAPKSEYDESSKIRRSYYQSDVFGYNYFFREGADHPEANDTLAALSNYVFYQKLNLLGDIEAHHLFEIISSFLVVFAVAFFVYRKFGLVASIMSSLSLVIYPLFSESHFNIKDPVVASFMGVTIVLFYFGIVSQNWKSILASSVFFGLAIGTKMNAVFVIPVLGPWLIYYLFIEKSKKDRIAYLKEFVKKKGLLFSLLIYPFLAFSVTYALSPLFWTNPWERVLAVVDYYKKIGVGIPDVLLPYVVKGVNLFSVFWFAATVQIPVLVLFLVGLVRSLYLLIKRRDGFYLLVIFWFGIPFIRVTFLNTNIYGGIRQIMEFLPAMAILVGIGGTFLLKKFRFNMILVLLLFGGFAFSIFEMIKIHPNENVYFNQLVGGLSGAREKNIPYWGDSYGNVNQQGINWLNQNAERGAKVALPVSSTLYFPRIKFRDDINYSNAYLSGEKHLGEYVMDYYFNWDPIGWYKYSYYDAFLKPVYEVKVDGVPLLKIWKNSPEYLNSGYEKEVFYYPQKIDTAVAEVIPNVFHKKMIIDLGKEIFLTKIKLNHSSIACDQQIPGYGYVAISSDGTKWQREPEEIASPQIPLSEDMFNNETISFFLAAKKARYIMIDAQMKNPCLLKSSKVSIRGLQILP